MSKERNRYKIKDLLNDGILNDYEYVTKDLDCSDITISSVSVQELPMKEYLSPGELVLTTALGSAHESDILSEIISEAGSAGASAVLIAFTEEKIEIPEEAVRMAYELKLPVFVIDARQRFSEIQERINAGIFRTINRPFEELQASLFNAYFNGRTLEDATKLISESLGCNVSISDTEDEIIAMSGETNEKKSGLKAATEHNSGEKGETYTELKASEREIAEPKANEGHNSYAHGAPVGPIPIELSGTVLGYLRLGWPALTLDLNDHADDHNVPLTRDIEGRLKQYVIFPLSLWFNRERIRTITEAGIKSDFAMKLSKCGAGGPDETITREAGYLNLDLTKRFRAVIIEPVVPSRESLHHLNTSSNPGSDLSSGFSSCQSPCSSSYLSSGLNSVQGSGSGHALGSGFSSGFSSDPRFNLAKRSADIVRAAELAGNKNKIEVIAGSDSGRFIAFVECSFSKEIDEINSFIDNWTAYIKKLMPEVSINAGISSSFVSNEGFSNAYNEAMISCSYCRSRSDNALIGNVPASDAQVGNAINVNNSEQFSYDSNGNYIKKIFFEETRKIRIMTALESVPSIREDADRILKGLMDYDRSGSSMELMKTLAVYIQNASNTSATARMLNIHRQSLLARLEKIEALTGLCLKDPDDMFVLEAYRRLYQNF